jgi:pimeloyl-ACP methyl ester carboxylesterase
MFVREAGQGRPLVLIHGFSVSHLEFRRAFDMLADGARVVALDLPGHGESEAPTDYPYTYEAFADSVCALMSALGLSRATVLGHSMGGGVALRLAAAVPDRVERLILCDAACVPLALPLEGRIPLLPGIGRWLFRHVFREGDLRRYFRRRVFLDPAALDDEVLGYYWRHLHAHRDALHRALGTVARSGELALLYSSVVCPTLLLWGDSDRIFSVRQAEGLAAALPRASLQVLPSCGHSPPEEEPQRFAAAVLGFLA